MKFKWFGALTALGWLGCASAQSMFGTAQITSIPATPVAGAPFDIEVKGAWGDGCGPVVRLVEVRELDISIRVSSPPDAFCTSAITPFRIRVSPFTGTQVARAGTYRVRFSDSIEGERLRSFELVAVKVTANAPAMSPDAGHWVAQQQGEFANSGPGVGFLIERQGSQVWLVTSVYSGDGKPTWHVGSAPVVGSVAQGSLFETAGGQPLFERYRGFSIKPYGRFHIEFKSATNAVIWFSKSESEGFGKLDLQPISVTRFNFGYGIAGELFRGKWQVAIAGATSFTVDLIPTRFGAFSLVGARDATDRYTLQCTIEISNPTAPPKSCELLDGSTVLANFDVVGQSVLRGRSPVGNDAVLVRLSP